MRDAPSVSSQIVWKRECECSGVLTLQQDCSQELKNEVELLFMPSVVLLQFLDLVGLNKHPSAKCPSQNALHIVQFTYSLANNTHRDTQSFVPFAGSKGYRDWASGVGQVSSSSCAGIHSSLAITPLCHGFLHDHLCIVVERDQNRAEKANPLS